MEPEPWSRRFAVRTSPERGHQPGQAPFAARLGEVDFGTGDLDFRKLDSKCLARLVPGDVALVQLGEVELVANRPGKNEGPLGRQAEAARRYEAAILEVLEAVDLDAVSGIAGEYEDAVPLTRDYIGPAEERLRQAERGQRAPFRLAGD